MTDDEFQAWLDEGFENFKTKAAATDAACAPYREREYNLHDGTLTFFDNSVPKLRASVQVVGTTAPNDFLWAWANDCFPPHVLRDAQTARDFGVRNGLLFLSRERFDPQNPRVFGWEMTAATARLTDAIGATAVPYGDDEGRLTFFLLHDLRPVEFH